MPESKDLAIVYRCSPHQHVFWWNESRGWVEDPLEATEYTWQEARNRHIELERVLSMDCRTTLMTNDQCNGDLVVTRTGSP